MHLNDLIKYCKILINELPEEDRLKVYLNGRISKYSQDFFDFGYFPNLENLSKLTSLINEEELIKLGIIDKKNTVGISKYYCPMFNYNLIMPYRDVYGDTVALVGRTLLSDEERGSYPKYMNTVFDKGRHLFGLYQAKKSIIDNNCAIIVEGQFDCISAFDKGITNIVALGSSNMTADQFSLLLRYTDNLFLLLDNDEAGESGRNRIKSKYGQYANIKDLHLPSGYKDIDEYLKDNGSELFDIVIN